MTASTPQTRLARWGFVALGALALGCEAQAAEQPAAVSPAEGPAHSAVRPPAHPAAEVQPAAVESNVARPAASEAAAKPEAHADPRPLSVVEVEDGAGPLAEQIAVQARRAERRGQRVFLEMGAPWCGPCKRVKALLADEDGIRKQLDGVVLLRVNSDIFGDELDALGFSDRTIPTFYALDSAGRRTDRVAHGHRWKNRASVARQLVAFLRAE